MKINDQLPVFSAEKEFSSVCNSLVQVKTTGYAGGDSGHGGFAEFTFAPMESFNACVELPGEKGGHFFECSTVKIRVGGDAEIEQFIDALRFAASKLEMLTKKQ
jgi:hypothetical protein